MGNGIKYYHIEKLFNGYCSIRDYVVDNCIRDNKYLIVLYQGKSMVLSPQGLKTKKYQLNPNKFTSKWQGNYALWDYEWTPDNKQMEFSL